MGTSRVAGCLYRCHTALKSKAEKKIHFDTGLCPHWVVCGVARAGSQLAAKLAAKAKFVRKPHSGRRAPQGSRNRGEYVARIILGSCWDLRLTIHRLNS